MIKKALHRITVIWCLYGLARILIFLNPYVMWLFEKYLDPDYGELGTGTRVVGCVIAWLLIVVIGGFLCLAGCAIHHFSNWFFNSDTKN